MRTTTIEIPSRTPQWTVTSSTSSSDEKALWWRHRSRGNMNGSPSCVRRWHHPVAMTIAGARERISRYFTEGQQPGCTRHRLSCIITCFCCNVSRYSFVIDECVNNVSKVFESRLLTICSKVKKNFFLFVCWKQMLFSFSFYCSWTLRTSGMEIPFFFDDRTELGIK